MLALKVTTPKRDGYRQDKSQDYPRVKNTHGFGGSSLSIASALAVAVAMAADTALRPATPPSTPVQSNMMSLIIFVYILSMGAIFDIG
jgi:hypothetical protein